MIGDIRPNGEKGLAVPEEMDIVPLAYHMITSVEKQYSINPIVKANLSPRGLHLPALQPTGKEGRNILVGAGFLIRCIFPHIRLGLVHFASSFPRGFFFLLLFFLFFHDLEGGFWIGPALWFA